MKLFTSICILLAVSFNSLACSCAQLGEISQEEVDKTDVIFTGKATKVEINRETYKRVITFEVEMVLKGEKSTQEFIVVTSLDGSSCGLDVEEGEEWFVFANENDGVYRTNMCTRSSKISKPQLDKKVLGREIYKSEKKNFRLKRKQFKKDRKMIKNVFI